RQVSGGDGKDPLLRDTDGSRMQKLSDLAVDEPRRVVVAVATARPIDEDAIGAPDLRHPAAARKLVGERAQAGAAFSLEAGRNGIASVRWGARPRRVRKNVQSGDPRLLDDFERPL